MLACLSTIWLAITTIPFSVLNRATGDDSFHGDRICCGGLGHLVMMMMMMTCQHSTHKQSRHVITVFEQKASTHSVVCLSSINTRGRVDSVSVKSIWVISEMGHPFGWMI